MAGGIKEECGLFGIALNKDADVSRITYYALYALQHRGQEGAGIAVCRDGVITAYKDAGLVNDVFSPQVLEKLPQGNMAVGHVRYGTTGNDPRLNVQPLVINHLKGRMALAHNGNLTNDYELRRDLEEKGSIFHTTSDSEVIAYTITRHRPRNFSKSRPYMKLMSGMPTVPMKSAIRPVTSAITPTMASTRRSKRRCFSGSSQMRARRTSCGL